jgi:hypothetical protein
LRNRSRFDPSTLSEITEDERIGAKNTPKKELGKMFFKWGKLPQGQCNRGRGRRESAPSSRKLSKEKSYLTRSPLTLI